MSFEIPGDLSTLDRAAIEAALQSAFAEARTFDDIATADLSVEQVERLDALASFAVAARGALTERDALQTRAAAAREVFGKKDETVQAPDGSEVPRAAEVVIAEGEPPVDAQVVEKPKDTKPAQTHIEGEPPIEQREGAEAQAEAEDNPEADVPENKTSAVSRAAGNAPATDEARIRQMPALTAAADVPGIPNGHTMANLDQIGEAVMARLKTYPHTPTAKVALRHGAAVFTPQGRLSQDAFRTDDELFAAAGNERLLPGGSLVAAGGWDAPSETLLDLCETEGPVRGIINLPEVTITRGGIRYTKGPTLADVMASATGFINLTEAQVEAGTAKTALRPGEPTFIEQRLDAVGVYVQAGLLTRAAWPELVRRYVELAIKAHAYKRSAKILAAIQANTGAANAYAAGFGNALDLLHVIELVVNSERGRLSAPEGLTFEVLLPSWTKSVIRMHLAQRTGQAELDVSDAQIDAWFALRGARVQYLINWQDIPRNAGGYPTAYPNTVEVIAYPAGTYVAGVSDVITLDTVYDSVLLEENHYIALFMEEGILVANPCGTGRRFTVPFVANGRTAAADTTANAYAAI